MSMKRRSCSNFDRKAKACRDGLKCSDACRDYERRVKWAQWKIPISLCVSIRYRYIDGESVRVCSRGFDMSRHNQACPSFERRKPKRK